MTAYIRNPLTYVWAFLTLITVAAWWLSQSGEALQANASVTVGVLLIAALKAQLVIQYFMEVRFGPAWLKYTTYGWVLAILVLLLLFYWVRF